MGVADTKAERLLEIEAMLLAHPDGMRQAELARRLGVHRSTICRYLPALTSQFQVYELDDGRLAIDRDSYLARLRLCLDEAMAVYLAARLLYRHSDLENPHVVTTLEKLGAAIGPGAPELGADIVATAEHMRSSPGRSSRAYVAAIETLTRGLARRRWVQLEYRRLGGHHVTECRFAPYVLEPVGPSFATYAIGLRVPPGELRTLKVERIRSIRLLDDTYEMPADSRHAALLEHAWGIWVPDGAGPVEVRLRFGARVRERVLESRWHSSEETRVEDGGTVLWRATVGDLTEIKPWIRGWGPEVEVIAPLELRRDIASELRRAAGLYASGPMPD